MSNPSPMSASTVSYAGATAHGKQFLSETIGRHPVFAGATIGVLALLVIVLWYRNSACQAKMSKSGFQTMTLSNLTTGNRNPQWQLGSADAGNWGPVSRDITPTQASVYTPAYRHPNPNLARANNDALARYPATRPPRQGRREGLETGPDDTTCGNDWDPAATAEAQALATTGSLMHSDLSEANLQMAIGAATDSDLDLSQNQMDRLTRHGDLS